MDEKQCMDMAVRIQEVDSRSKSNEHRINDCEDEIREIKTEQKAIYKIANSVENLATSMSDLQVDVKEVRAGQKQLNAKVNMLENQPALETKKRWDSLSDKLLGLFIAGIAGYLLATILPGIF